MALKPFNSVGGFSVGPNLTQVIDSDGNANVGNLTINGSADLSGDIVLAGNIVAQNITSNANLETSSLSVTLDANISGELTASGNLNANANLNVVGDAIVSGNIDASGTLNVDLAATFADTLDVTGAVTLQDTLDVDGNVTIGADLAVTGQSNLGNVANVHVLGGTTGQYLATDGSGNLSWVTLDTDTLANGTSNVSIDLVNGPVTIGVGGTANIAVFDTTGATVAGTVAATTLEISGDANIVGNVAFASGTGANLNLTTSLSTANLTANGNVTLGAVANVHISGGSNGHVLTTDSTGNLSWTNQSIKYSREIHVDSTLGNDTTGDGSYNRPYATIMKAHSMISSGVTVYLHVGGYSETVTWTKPNCDIIGVAAGGTVNTSGAWTVGCQAGSSVRIKDVSFGGAFTQNGAGRVIFQSSYLRNTYTKTSGEYAQFDDTDAAGTGISIASAGTVVFNGGSQNMISVSNASAVVSIMNTIATASITVTAGTVVAADSYIYALTNTGNAVTTSAGSAVYLYNSHCVAPNSTLARISVAGFWTANDTQYDKANSTLTGTNLGTISHFDAINTHGIANVGSVTVRGTSTLGAVGNVSITGGSSGQYLQTNGSGALSWTTVELANIHNGTSNVAINTANGDISVGANGQANIFTITSTGSYATSTFVDDVVITGNLTVQGNTVQVNITELNVEDPVISTGRGPDNAVLTADDGKDRGLFSYYYDGAEKGAFVGLMTHGAHDGEFVVSTDAAISNNVVTTSNYATVAVGAVNLSAVSKIGAITLTTTSTSPAVLATIPDSIGLAVEFLIKGSDSTGGKFEVATLLAVSNGSGQVDETVYGTVQIGGATGVFSASKVGANIEFAVVPASSNSTDWTVQYRII